MVCIRSTHSPDVMRSGSSVIIRYLDEHVRQGYTFLMQNYRPGDKICIFGFSRGAYTARALAGFLHKVRMCAYTILHLLSKS